MNNNVKIEVFLNTWGNYNVNGADGGFWIELPCDLDEVIERLAKSTGENVDDMEVFINDTSIEGINLDIEENDSIKELNELAETLTDFDEMEVEVFEAALEHGCSFEEASKIISNYEYTVYTNCSDMTEVAEQYCDECGILDSIPENLRYYFDFESYGKDMDLEGSFYFVNNNCIQFF